MKPGSKHKPETIEKQREGGRRARARELRLARVTPADVKALLKGRAIKNATLRLSASRATADLADWLDALGRRGPVSPYARALLDSAYIVTTWLYALNAQLLSSGSAAPEDMSRIATLVDKQRQLLASVFGEIEGAAPQQGGPQAKTSFRVEFVKPEDVERPNPFRDLTNEQLRELRIAADRIRGMQQDAPSDAEAPPWQPNGHELEPPLAIADLVHLTSASEACTAEDDEEHRGHA